MVVPCPLFTSEMHIHWPSALSLQRETLLSPPETASMLPPIDLWNDFERSRPARPLKVHNLGETNLPTDVPNDIFKNTQNFGLPVHRSVFIYPKNRNQKLV